MKPPYLYGTFEMPSKLFKMLCWIGVLITAGFDALGLDAGIEGPVMEVGMQTLLIVFVFGK